MEIMPAHDSNITKRFVSYLHVKNCDVDIAKQMILLGADVNYTDSNLNTLIHIVLQHCVDKLSLVHELLVAGANSNGYNKHKKSALHYAVMYSDGVEVLRELIDHGAIVHSRDNKNNSPLHLAVRNNKKSFVEFLIKSGADVNLRNSKGESPLALAVKNGNLGIVKVLLSSRASVFLEDNNRMSPLHLALKNRVSNESILIELMSHGADMYSMDLYFGFPLDYAVLKMCANPSDNSARTLIKCNHLKYSSASDNKFLFNLLRKYEIYLQLDALYQDCIREVRNMKSELIHENFCLLDFALKGFEFNPLFGKKTGYRKRVFNHVLYISRKYPTYTDVMAYRLGKLDLCLKSMELCVYTLKECPEGKQRVSLTPDTIFLIAGLLSAEDVLNLITAFSDPQQFATHDFGFQDLALGKSTKRKLSVNC